MGSSNQAGVPARRPWRRWVLGVVVAGLALFFVSVAREVGRLNTAMTAGDDLTRRNNEINPQVVGWRYETETDKMRGITSKTASLQADDYNPYMTPTLVLWHKSNGEEGAQLASPMTEHATSYQCDYRTSVISVKIDGGKIRTVPCQMGMSVVIHPKLVKMLRNTKTMMLEVGADMGGKQQLSFHTAGLKL